MENRTSLLTVFSFVDASTFFLVITGSAIVTLLAVALFMREPKGGMAEILPDGTVHVIEVS